MRRIPMIAVMAALGLVAAACNGPDDGGAIQPPDGETPAGGNTVSVSLVEWDVVATPTAATAGSVAFNASNDGSQEHEFVVIATSLPADQLPQDGGSVDETAEDVTVIDEIEPFAPGQSNSLTISLDAGSYVLICNIPGHYDLGMRTAFSVN